jgi:hypothetical protein
MHMASMYLTVDYANAKVFALVQTEMLVGA